MTPIKTGKPVLTEKELIKALRVRTKLSKKEATELVDAFFDSLVELWKQKATLLISGYFRLKAFYNSGRVTRIVFRSSPQLYDKLKQLENYDEKLRNRNRDLFYGSAKGRREAMERLGLLKDGD